MTAGEQRPQRFGEIVDAALSAWAARWPLYVGMAAASILLQFLCTLAAGSEPLVLVIANAILDAFPSAVVSIDVAARAGGDAPPQALLLRAASLRWPGVAIILILVNLVLSLWITPTIFGNADDTLYGALILPGLAIMGILALPAVIASIDTTIPLLALPAFSLLRSFFIGTTWPNLGRLCIAGAMLAVPMMAETILQNKLHARGLPDSLASFWSNIPVDAIVLVPFQAFFTFLYLDFVARQSRR